MQPKGPDPNGSLEHGISDTQIGTSNNPHEARFEVFKGSGSNCNLIMDNIVCTTGRGKGFELATARNQTILRF